MDPRDVDLIHRFQEQDAELQELWVRHRSLEGELRRMDAQRFLTPEEQVRRKELQKAKLAGRDRIETLLERYRQGAPTGTDECSSPDRKS